MPQGVAVCVPAMDHVKTGFAKDLAIMMGAYMAGFHKSQRYAHLIIVRDSLIARGREKLVMEALEDKNTTHLLWLDSDMRFPSDIIERMLEHDVPVVGANCAHRRGLAMPTAWEYIDNDGLKPGSRRVFTEKDSTGLQRVSGMGGAVLMVKREVYEQLGRPWHFTPWMGDDPNDLAMLGEDSYFFARCWKDDIPVYVDHDLSWQVGHLGEYEYSMQDALRDQPEIRKMEQEKLSGDHESE